MRIYTVNVTATFTNQVQVAANSEQDAIEIATDSACEHTVFNADGEYTASVIGSRVGLHPFLIDQSSLVGWRAMNFFEQRLQVKAWLESIGAVPSNKDIASVIERIGASIEGVL